MNLKILNKDSNIICEKSYIIKNKGRINLDLTSLNILYRPYYIYLLEFILNSNQNANLSILFDKDPINIKMKLINSENKGYSCNFEENQFDYKMKIVPCFGLILEQIDN